MDIQMQHNENELFVALGGRLDSSSSPQFESEILSSLDGIAYLEIDFSNLEYVSSAGLRVILVLQKKMNKQGRMCIKNVADVVMEVFNITGFSGILTIE